MNAPRRKPLPFRLLGRGTSGVGIALVLAGAVGLVVAAALPWATLTVLNTPVALPGVAVGLGAITAAIGVICIAQFGILRRFAYLGVALGLLAAYIGVRAEAETGKVIVQQLLAVQRRLAPVNARLAEVSMPPIEPFGSAIGSRRDHVGVGIGYTAWAGAVVATGSVLLLAGERLRRTCGNCSRAWNAKRGETPAHCPRCGNKNTDETLCHRCNTPLLRGETFCVTCGAGTSPAAKMV